MKSGIRFKAFRVLLIVAGVQMGIGCALQNRLIFPGEKLGKDHVFTPFMRGEEVGITAKDGVKLSAIRYANFKSRQIILYFHGNGGSLDSWRYEYADLTYLHRDMIFIDYRGYGKSEGTVSEEGLYADAQAAYEYARSLGYADVDIFIYGRSIGSGIAVDVAQNKNLAGLILESPYSSLREMIYKEYWFMLPYFYLSYSLNNCGKMKNIRTKVLMLHGTEDHVVPFKYGKKLSGCFDGPQVFQAIKGGGHNDLSRFEEKKAALASFFGKE